MDNKKEQKKTTKVLVTLQDGKPYEELKEEIKDKWNMSFSELVEEWVDLTLDAIRKNGMINVSLQKPQGPFKKLKEEKKE